MHVCFTPFAVFRDTPSGIMLFHCLQPSDCGGGASIMADAFRIAADLRHDDPAAFDLLTKAPITQRRFITGVGLRSERPAITLDRFGDVCEVRWNERTMGPIDVGAQSMRAAHACSLIARRCEDLREVEDLDDHSYIPTFLHSYIWNVAVSTCERLKT